jgi:predicted nucleic acid-binding protein
MGYNGFQMKRLRLYLDTTVWNFPFSDQAPDYRDATLEFFQRVRWGFYDVYFSDVVVDEVDAAPKARYDQVHDLLAEIAPQRLLPHPEIDRLADLYRRRKVLPVKSVADSQHVAYATYYGVDALLSWNFKHLANMTRRARVNAVNMEQGYNLPLVLATPLEVLNDEGEN